MFYTQAKAISQRFLVRIALKARSHHKPCLFKVLYRWSISLLFGSSVLVLHREPSISMGANGWLPLRERQCHTQQHNMLTCKCDKPRPLIILEKHFLPRLEFVVSDTHDCGDSVSLRASAKRCGLCVVSCFQHALHRATA